MEQHFRLTDIRLVTPIKPTNGEISLRTAFSRDQRRKNACDRASGINWTIPGRQWRTL